MIDTRRDMILHVHLACRQNFNGRFQKQRMRSAERGKEEKRSPLQCAGIVSPFKFLNHMSRLSLERSSSAQYSFEA